MLEYNYPYPVDDNTQKLLSELDDTAWIEVFKRVLDEKSIDFNIEFNEFEPKARLCTLYAVLLTKNITTDKYQEALINLTYEIYLVPEKSDTSFILIQVIDYVRPAKHFQRLALLVTNPAYEYMIAVKAPNGLLLHLFLVNAIMHFDVKFTIYNYLKTLSKSIRKYPPEYHQVYFRYIYTYCDETEFINYLNESFLLFENKKISHIVKLTLKEYVFIKRSFRLIYLWLSENTHYLVRLNQNEFNYLIDFFAEWFEQNEKKLAENEFFEVTKQLVARLYEDKVADIPATITINSMRKRMRRVFNSVAAVVYQKSELPLLLGRVSIASDSNQEAKTEKASKEDIQTFSREVEAVKQLPKVHFEIPVNDEQ